MLLNSGFQEIQPQFSPDGRYIAYMSNESGVNQVFVQPFSSTGSEGAGGKSTISKGSGVFPRWRGTQLIYMTGAGEVMPVDVSTEKAFQFENLKRLFLTAATPTAVTGSGDISADGKKFLFVTPQGISNTPSPFIVILNWQAALKK